MARWVPARMYASRLTKLNDPTPMASLAPGSEARHGLCITSMMRTQVATKLFRATLRAMISGATVRWSRPSHTA